MGDNRIPSGFRGSKTQQTAADRWSKNFYRMEVIGHAGVLIIPDDTWR